MTLQVHPCPGPFGFPTNLFTAFSAGPPSVLTLRCGGGSSVVHPSRALFWFVFFFVFLGFSPPQLLDYGNAERHVGAALRRSCSWALPHFGRSCRSSAPDPRFEVPYSTPLGISLTWTPPQAVDFPGLTSLMRWRFLLFCDYQRGFFPRLPPVGSFRGALPKISLCGRLATKVLPGQIYFLPLGFRS